MPKKFATISAKGKLKWLVRKQQTGDLSGEQCNLGRNILKGGPRHTPHKRIAETSTRAGNQLYCLKDIFLSSQVEPKHLAEGLLMKISMDFVTS